MVSALEQLLRRIADVPIDERIEALIGAIDTLVARQVEDIRTHPQFSALRAAWAGLWLVVRQVEPSDGVECELLNCSWTDLRRSIANSPRPGLAIDLFRAVVSTDENGRRPVAAIITCYEIDGSEETMAILEACCAAVAVLQAPFIVSAGEAFFDVDTLGALAQVGAPDAADWCPQGAYRRFRDKTASMYAVIATPRVDVGKGWVSPSFPVAALLARSFAAERWCVNIVGDQGGGRLDDVVTHARRPPVATLFSPAVAEALGRHGITTLRPGSRPGSVLLHDAVGAYRVPSFGPGEAQENASRELAAVNRLPLRMLVSRVAHYLQLVYHCAGDAWRREAAAHGEEEARFLERGLNRWLDSLVRDSTTDPEGDLYARHPLDSALLRVAEGVGGRLRYELHVRPSFRIRVLAHERPERTRLKTEGFLPLPLVNPSS